jgi:site-specific DNA-methyltransferase (adenine-specific)/modification methylase
VFVVERVMDGERADAVVTDPPYGIGVDKSMHENGGQQYGNAAAPKRHYADTNWDVKPDKDTIDFVLSLAPVSVVWGGNYFELPPTRCVLVWDKENGGNQFADCELAWTNLDKPVRIIRHMWNGMLRAGREERTPHPTQKPIGVMVWAVEQTGDNCVVVIDPFSGSGTTLIACERLGRKCRAIEIDPGYVAVALERWSVATGKTPELING